MDAGFTERLIQAIRQAHETHFLTDDPSRVFTFLLESLVSLTDSEYGFLDEVLRDEQGNPYKLSLALSDISWDDSSRKLYESLVARSLEFRNLDNLAGAPAVLGELVVTNDAPRDPRAGGLPAGHPAIGCYMGMPLYFGSELVGVAGVANRPGGYEREHADRIEPLLSTCAGMIYAKRQREKEKRHLKEMEESNLMMDAILNASPESSFLIDANGIVLKGNPVFAARLNRSVHDLIGKNIFDFLPDEIAKNRRRQMDEMLQSGLPHRFEDEKNGRIFRHHMVPIRNINQEIDRVAIFAEDITESVSAEAALRESEEKYRVLFDAFPLGITVSDRSGRIVETNKAAEKILGVGKSEHETRNIDGTQWNIVRPDGTPMSAEEYPSVIALKENRVVADVELGIVRPGGEISWIDATAAPLDLANLGMLVTYSDITERLSMRRALRESEERFRALVESAPLFILLLQHGKYIYGNPAACSMLGYDDPETIKGMDALQTISPDYHRSILERMERAKRGEKNPLLEMEIIRPDGQRVWSETQSLPIVIDGEPATLIAGLDITDRKQNQERSLILGEMVDSAPNSITVHDPEGRFLYANKKTFELHGYLPQEFMAINLHQLDVPESAERINERIRIAREQGEVTFEAAHYRKDGSILPLEITVKPTTWHGTPGFLSIARDITERKQALDALRESEERFRYLFEKAPLGYQSLDEKGNFIALNDTWCSVLGYAKEEVLGRNFSEFIHPDDREQFASNFPRFKQEGHILGVEFRMIRRDGSTLLASFDGRIGRNLDGSFLQTHCVLSDITERKMAEEELRRSEANFRSLAERNAILLNEVNHRVKNNLTAIIGLLVAHQRFVRSDLRDEIRIVIRDIGRRIETIAKAHNLLSMARWEPVSLMQLEREILQSVSQVVVSGKQMAFSVTGDDMKIPAERVNSLALLLYELAANSIKHGLADRSEIAVEIANRRSDEELMICYRDTGPGYPEPVLNGQASNLGLHLVRTLAAHDLRGRLTLRNDPGAAVELILGPGGDVLSKRDLLEQPND